MISLEISENFFVTFYLAAGFGCGVTNKYQILCIGQFADFGQLGSIPADRGRYNIFN